MLPLTPALWRERVVALMTTEDVCDSLLVSLTMLLLNSLFTDSQSSNSVYIAVGVTVGLLVVISIVVGFIVVYR